MRATTLAALAAFAAAVVAGPALAAQNTSLAGASPHDGDVFLMSAALTLAVANAYLLMDGREPIYCAPEGTGPESADALWRAVDGRLTGPHSAENIAIALLDALRTEFPC